ncbi:MAG: glycosyltransferase family 4 protein [Anaerolineae bacterium]|nr:glycosyltransferase family 4 protein [Anaerolineae bacterium]
MNNPKNVLMLVNTFAYDDPRVIAEAKALQRGGYTVTIIGAARNTNRDAPSRGLYQGIPILLTPMIKSYHLKEILFAFWKWISGSIETTMRASQFHKTNIISLIFFNLWCWRFAFGMRPDIIHCHDFSPLPAAWLLAKLRRVPLIYDAHESAPDMYAGLKSRLVRRAEGFFIRRSTRMITVGERLARSLVERGAKQVTVIGNWKSRTAFQPDSQEVQAERTRMKLNQYHLIIAYFGTLDPSREILPLLDAIRETPDVALLIGGSGPMEDAVIRGAQEATNIHWMGWVNMAQIPLYTGLADVVYYCLAIPDNESESQNNYFSTPNKLFEAFAAGKALIARRGVGEMSEILAKFPAALLLDTVTAVSLRDAFTQLGDQERLADLQRQAQAASLEYNWESAEKRLYALYESLMNAPQSH